MATDTEHKTSNVGLKGLKTSVHVGLWGEH